MQNSVQLRKERRDLILKSRQILERAGDKELDTEAQSEYEKMQSDIDGLMVRIERLEKQEGDEKELDEPCEENHRDDEEDDEKEDDRKRSKRGVWSQPETRDVRGSESYRKSFANYIRNGQMNRELRDLSLTGADGAGYLALPVQLSKDFVTLLQNYTFVRDLAHVEPVTDAKSLGNGMWLTKDQRRLLAGYVHNSGIHGKHFDATIISNKFVYENSRLLVLLESPRQKVYEYDDNDKPDIPQAPFSKEEHEKYLRNRVRLDLANHFLIERGLVEIEKHKSASVILVALTLQGYDLGQRYLTKAGTFDLWYQQHKNGVLGFLLSLAGGVLGGFISHWTIKHFSS